MFDHKYTGPHRGLTTGILSSPEQVKTQTLWAGDTSCPLGGPTRASRDQMQPPESDALLMSVNDSHGIRSLYTV